MAILFAIIALLLHDPDWKSAVWPRPICLGLAAVTLGRGGEPLGAWAWQMVASDPKNTVDLPQRPGGNRELVATCFKWKVNLPMFEGSPAAWS